VRLGPAPVVRLERPLAHLYVSPLDTAEGSGTRNEGCRQGHSPAQGTAMLAAVKPGHGTSARGPGSNQRVVHCLWTTSVENDPLVSRPLPRRLDPVETVVHTPLPGTPGRLQERPTRHPRGGLAPELRGGVRTSTLSGRSGEIDSLPPWGGAVSMQVTAPMPWSARRSASPRSTESNLSERPVGCSRPSPRGWPTGYGPVVLHSGSARHAGGRRGTRLQPAGSGGMRPAPGGVRAHDAGPLPYMHSVWTTVWTTSPSRDGDGRARR
jgi:hypothetical protein